MTARQEAAGVQAVDEGGADAGVEEAAQLRVALVRLQRQLRARSDSSLTASQTSVLARVEESGPLRMGALAKAEGTSPATVCRLIDSLAQDGLIERVPDPLDGRASLVQASPEGASLLRAVRAQGTAALRSALDDLSVGERSLIRQALPALQALTDRLQGGSDARMSGSTVSAP
jgi:DNA-binding MarR family transcriptional regulator